MWYIEGSTNGPFSYRFGQAGDTPIPADFDGDGVSDLGIYEPDTGIWHIHASSNGYSGKILGGAVGDWPLAFDVTGDDKADNIVYQKNSTWHISASEDGSYTGINWGGFGMIPFGFTINISADKLALYDPASRTFHVYPGGNANMLTLPVGPDDMIPVCADYDGDGLTDFAAFSHSSGEWVIQKSTDGSIILVPDTVTIQWGSTSSTPIGVRE